MRQFPIVLCVLTFVACQGTEVPPDVDSHDQAQCVGECPGCPAIPGKTPGNTSFCNQELGHTENVCIKPTGTKPPCGTKPYQIPARCARCGNAYNSLVTAGCHWQCTGGDLCELFFVPDNQGFWRCQVYPEQFATCATTGVG